ncbi:hypothetical protein BCPG3_162 [Bacillus phage BCPG3]|nr:hypothetical protein BCPG3_162 [Bacillus phage BCPG3]
MYLYPPYTSSLAIPCYSFYIPETIKKGNYIVIFFKNILLVI